MLTGTKQDPLPQNNDINTLHEEFKVLKTEIYNFKSVLAVRAEVKLLEESVKDIRDEIQQLTAINTNISERIKHVEEKINCKIEDESDSDIDMNLCYFAPPKAVNGRGRARCSYFLCTFPPAHIRSGK